MAAGHSRGIWILLMLWPRALRAMLLMVLALFTTPSVAMATTGVGASLPASVRTTAFHSQHDLPADLALATVADASGAGAAEGPVADVSGSSLALSVELVAPEAAIRITDNGLQHAIDRHTALGPLARNKSVFFDGEDLTALIRRADASVPLRQGQGNGGYVVDAAREIGVDRFTGLPTSQYTVITRSDGTLVTTFPGLPARGR